MVGAGIVETKQDNANKISTTQREDLAKIQVEGENDSFFLQRQLKNVTVGKPLQSSIS